MTNSLIQRLTVATTLVVCAVFDLAEAAEQEVYWTAPVPTRSEAQRAQEELYLNLFNTGRMQFQLVHMGDHERLEDVMRAKGAWVGPMTDRIAAMLCTVNGFGCNMKTAPLAQTQQTDHGTHVAGILATNQTWTLSSGDLVWIPDIQILQVSTPAPAERGSKIQYQGLEVKSTCLSPEYCLNDYQANIPDWQTKGYLRSVIVATRDEAGEGRAVKLVPELNARIKLNEQPLGIYSFIRKNNGLRYEFRDPSFEKLNAGIGKGIVGSMSIELENAPSDTSSHALNIHHGEPLSEHSQMLLDHFCNKPVHGGCPDLTGRNFSGLVIGVMDQTPETRHCDLKINARVLAGNEFVQPHTADEDTSEANQTTCDAVRLPGQVLGTDHGTHVLGILAAPINEKGMGGLLGGFPDLSYLLIPFSEADGARVSEGKARAMADAIDSAGSGNASVINLSFSYTLLNRNRTDLIGSAIRKWMPDILFVVAAGKDGSLFTAQPVGTPGALPPCLSPPACYASHVDNIIGVVGLEPDLEALTLLRASSNSTVMATNFGASVFDIGAPARDIMSTVGMDGFGPLSGTSQAAPQVTAAAALLKKITGATPKQVRNRLTYTARMSLDSTDKMKGGALDATAALRVDRDWMHLSNDCKLAGKISRLSQIIGGSPVAGSFDIIPVDGGEEKYIRVSDMRRIHWNKVLNKGVFFLKDGYEIERVIASYLTAQGQNHVLIMNVETVSPECGDEYAVGGVAEVQLSNVVDFVSRMEK